MESEQLITKITQTLKRPDGSEVRIVVDQAFGSGLTPSLGVYVLRRPTTADNWQLCKPHRTRTGALCRWMNTRNTGVRKCFGTSPSAKSFA